MTFHLPIKQAEQLLNEHDSPFSNIFKHGSLQVELYQPDKVDLQTPHDRDEIYVIVSGCGTFELESVTIQFQPGDVIHVPAMTDHRFINFDDDFKTWVFFYGPFGGETSI